MYGLHNPANAGVYNGQRVITWRGTADIRFGGTFVAPESSGPATGSLVDGRRTYRLEGGTSAPSLTVREIDPDDPIREIRCWLPDPRDPANSSLEGELWHPLLLERIADRDWGVIRAMGLLATNANPQRDWIDRPRGAVPAFATPHFLPTAEVGQPYATEASTSGGDGSRRLVIVGSFLATGLAAAVDGGRLRVEGVPGEVGTSYVYCRVTDEDGDPAWRTFSVRAVRPSSDPAVRIDFEAVPLTVDAAAPEPLEIDGYRLTSSGNSGGRALLVQGAEPEGWHGSWGSHVLKSAHWGSSQRLERADGRLFDLASVDVAMFQGRSVRIRARAPDGLTFERAVDLPQRKTPMTTVHLDWVSIERVELTWHELPGAAGGGRSGAIDEVLINQVSSAARTRFIRGDANADGSTDVSDAIGILVHLFASGDPPPCLDSADADDDGELDISDPIALLAALFVGAVPPPPPAPGCGEDPTEDLLTCDGHPPCL